MSTGKFANTTLLETTEENSAVNSATESVNQQPGRGKNVNRYNLKFHKETKEEIELRKEEARKAIISESSEGLELGSDYCFIPGLFIFDINHYHKILYSTLLNYVTSF
jgi:hypothetical protein